jgi:hypothetical protein
MPKLPGKKSKDTSDSNSTRVALRAVDGTLRELDEKDLYLETPKRKILKFRTLAKTQFRDKEGEQVRDSLLKPGDQLSVEVNGDDPETALRVILTRKSTDAERSRAERPFDHAAAQTPMEADTHSSGATEATAEPSARSKPDTSDTGDRQIPTLAKAGTSDSTQPEEKAAPPIESRNPFHVQSGMLTISSTRRATQPTALPTDCPIFSFSRILRDILAGSFLLNGRCWTLSQPKWRV